MSRSLPFGKSGPALPLLAATSVLLAEMILVRAYLDDIPLRRTIPALAAMPILLTALVLALALLTTIQRRHSRRVLVLTGNGLQFWHADRDWSCRWNLIKQVSIHSFPGEYGLFHVIVERFAGKRERREELLLESRAQADDLAGNLRQFSQNASTSLKINVSHETPWQKPPTPRPTPRMLPFILFSLSFLFFVNGLPIFIFALRLPPPTGQSGSSSSERVNRPRHLRLERDFESFVSTFKSPEDALSWFQKAAGLTGGALLASSALLWIGADQISRRHRESEAGIPSIYNPANSKRD